MTICLLPVLVYPQAEEMINDVRDAFKANLKSLEWMDNETRDAAESKADAITDMIGEFLCHFTAKELKQIANRGKHTLRTGRLWTCSHNQ